MEKLTLSVYDKRKIDWVKAFAKTNETSVSQLFENYLEALMAFNREKVMLSDSLKRLRQPGKRPTPGEIDRHLIRRRSRK